MPDFLDSLIGQVKETNPTLRPRTPGLFEPTPSRGGLGFPAGEHFDLARDSSLDDARDPDSEDLANNLPNQPANPSSRGPKLASLSGESQASHSASDPSGGRLDMHPQADHQQTDQPLHRKNPRSAPLTYLRSRLNNLEDLTRRVTPSARQPGGQSFSRSEQPSLPLEDEPAPLRQQGRTFTSSSHTRQDVSPGQSEDGSSPPPITMSQSERTFSRRGANPLQALSAEIEALWRESANENTTEPDVSTASPVALPPTPSNLVPTRRTERHTQPGENLARGEAPLLIYVSIGRVEVRAAPTPSPALPNRSARRGSTPTSLEDYLHRTNGGSR